MIIFFFSFHTICVILGFQVDKRTFFGSGCGLPPYCPLAGFLCRVVCTWYTINTRYQYCDTCYVNPWGALSLVCPDLSALHLDFDPTLFRVPPCTFVTVWMISARGTPWSGGRRRGKGEGSPHRTQWRCSHHLPRGPAPPHQEVPALLSCLVLGWTSGKL